MFGKQIKKFLASKAGIAASHLYLIFSFGILDAWLRVMTRWIGAYSIYQPAPNLFTLLWAIVLTAIVTAIPSRKIGRIAYGVLYFVFMIFAVVQYGSYLVLGKFLYLSDFLLAGEGADYASWVVDLLSPAFVMQVLALIAVGTAGVLVYPPLWTSRPDALDQAYSSGGFLHRNNGLFASYVR